MSLMNENADGTRDEEEARRDDHNAASEADSQDAAAPAAAAEKKSRWTLTGDGCRTEVRLGLLLSMAGVFVWLWQGPGMGV